jgi:TetR/AcrR family transcriptional regulator
MNENQHSMEPGTERRILEAAAKVFMMKGKLGASMQDIADEAGINRTLLHYYFRSKDKLFDKVFEKLFAQVLPAMLGIMSSKSPLLERIERFVEAYTMLLRDNPYLPVFIFQEISLNPDRLAGTFREMGINPEQTLRGLKAELEQAGMAGTDPRHILASLMGMVLFPYIGRPLFQTIAFQGEEGAYEEFLSERTKLIPHFFKLALAGAAIQKQKS